MMTRLKLFFTYYGGKWRIAKHYAKPSHNIIIEPFAGSAGYALHYPDLDVRLYDLDPVICGVWDFLIKASRQDVLALPLKFDHVDCLNVSTEAKHLIGFWLNKGTAQPCKQPSKWMRGGLRPNSFWGEAIRDRIANQVDLIKHWSIENKPYADIKNTPATWFIDPPYQRSGSLYKFNSVDFDHLGLYVKERQGQVICCEQLGANWLPFTHFRDIKTTEGKHGKHRGVEVVYTFEEAA